MRTLINDTPMIIVLMAMLMNITGGITWIAFGAEAAVRWGFPVGMGLFGVLLIVGSIQNIRYDLAHMEDDE